MSDIIREVDEELRRENWEKLWKKYGKYLIGAAVAIVLVTAGVVGWRAYSEYRSAQAGEAFAAAIERSEALAHPAQGAEAMARYAADAPDGYAMLAKFREARLRAEGGDNAAAVAIYESLASDGDIDPLFQDLATLYAVRLQIGEVDAGTLIARLEPLTAQDNPWRYSARELAAIVALEAGNIETARTLYALLSDDPAAPQQQRSRAAEMLRAIGP